MGGDGELRILVVLRMADGGTDGEHRGLHAVLLQNGKSNFIIAEIPVVYGDAHRVGRQGRAAVDVIHHFLEADGAVTRLAEGLHVGREGFGGNLRILGRLLGEVVVHEDGRLHGVGAHWQTGRISEELVQPFLAVFFRHVHAEPLRPVDRFVAENLRQRHVAGSGAEVGGIVEVPRIIGHRGAAEIPVVHLPGQGSLVGPEGFLRVKGPLGLTDRGTDHHQLHPPLLAHVSDFRHRLDARLNVRQPVRVRLHIEAAGVGGGIDLRVPHLLHVPQPLVVAPAGYVEHIEHLGQLRIRQTGGGLVDGVLGIPQGVAEIKQGRILPAGQTVHPVVEGVLLAVVDVSLVDAQVHHQAFHLTAFQHIGRQVPVVPGIAAVDKKVIPASLHVFFHGLCLQGGGGGRADDIGVIRPMVLFQPGDLGRPWVVGFVVAVPIEKRVAEYAEGIDQNIGPRAEGQRQRHGSGQHHKPFFRGHRPS